MFMFLPFEIAYKTSGLGNRNGFYWSGNRRVESLTQLSLGPNKLKDDLTVGGGWLGDMGFTLTKMYSLFSKFGLGVSTQFFIFPSGVTFNFYDY